MRGRRRHHKKYRRYKFDPVFVAVRIKEQHGGGYGGSLDEIAAWIAAHPQHVTKAYRRAQRNARRFWNRCVKESAETSPRALRRRCIECRPKLRRRMLKAGQECSRCCIVVREDLRPIEPDFVTVMPEDRCKCGLRYGHKKHKDAVEYPNADGRPYLIRLCDRRLAMLMDNGVL